MESTIIKITLKVTSINNINIIISYLQLKNGQILKLYNYSTIIVTVDILKIPTILFSCFFQTSEKFNNLAQYVKTIYIHYKVVKKY